MKYNNDEQIKMEREKQKKLNFQAHNHAMFVSLYRVCSNPSFVFAHFIL